MGAGRRPFSGRVGARYGRWVVRKYAGHGRWWCRCDCGTKKTVRAGSLTRGDSRSCGCLKAEIHTTHGLSHTSEANTHMMMLQRCYNPSHDSYKDYGGRGIAVCDRWKGPEGLANFVADLGRKPSPKHRLDRIDNNGDYEPGNCRWTTEYHQQRNTSRNVNIAWDGRTMCAKDWAKQKGIGYMTLLYRIKKWGLERAMTEAVRRKVPAGFIDHQKRA